MSIEVVATKASIGWDVAVPGGQVVHVRTLAQAGSAVREHLATAEEIVVRPELGDVLPRVDAAKAANTAALAATQAAARQIRAVVRELRELGLSVTDIATIIGVSRGRVSQLAARTRWADRARH